MRRMNGKRFSVIGNDGDPCPRCGEPTQIREHGELRERHRRQPFYYSRWFYCTNERCITTVIHSSRYVVWKHDQEQEQKARIRAIRDQLRPRGYNSPPLTTTGPLVIGAEDAPHPPWEDPPEFSEEQRRRIRAIRDQLTPPR